MDVWALTASISIPINNCDIILWLVSEHYSTSLDCDILWCSLSEHYRSMLWSSHTYQTSGCPWPSATVRRKCNVPAPSFLELQRERRETTELGYPGPVSAIAPETHGPCSGPLVAKSLVYGSGPGSSWGDRASSPTRFNTYSRSSTHLGATRPRPGFFLSFGSLKLGHWDLGPGLVGTQDSISKEVKVCDWGPE
jgi:hypothetical protein